MPPPAINGIITGTAAGGLCPVDDAVHRFTDEIVREQSVSTETYWSAIEAVGQNGVLDLLNVIGMYLATAALLNALEVPAP